jgi:NAD(P)-dependent dehydrogenase (short-subunit alcohol dehydrogenase family)
LGFSIFVLISRRPRDIVTSTYDFVLQGFVAEVIHNLFDLSGKKALVTGGAIGVGRACATALAMAGADVAIVGRTQHTGERTCQLLKRFGVETAFFVCDVTNSNDVATMVAGVCERFGRIDIAVNNAGGGVAGAALALTDSEWERVIQLNLSSVYWCARAQAREMVKRAVPSGKIINIASIYASIAGGNCGYNTAKAGVLHLTRTLAAEWGSYNINVNSISPGWMLSRSNPISPELRARMRDLTPLGSLMRHRDMYGAVIYLASGASDFVTGHNLVIDGGHTTNTWLFTPTRRSEARTSPEEEEVDLHADISGLW